MSPTESGTILVVDDDRPTLALLIKVLGDKGYRVETASSGRDALSSAEASRPGLVLMDIAMPGMNGYRVAREMRARFGSSIPIVALTAVPESDPRRPSDVHFDGWLEKPFVVDDFLTTVQRHFRGA